MTVQELIEMAIDAYHFQYHTREFLEERSKLFNQFLDEKPYAKKRKETGNAMS